ncbi:MAG: response regulator transcription factor [Sporolactobacillus sp.]
MTKNILILDDEQEIADLVELFLLNENYRVYKYYEPAAALDCLRRHAIDLVVLDIMMPDMDGLSLCRTIRRSHTFPVIMLTAKVSDTDKITGLTVGADDYLTKPFSPPELVARVKAQLRRSTTYNKSVTDDASIIDFNGLLIDKRMHKCQFNGRPLHLTPTEFAILALLCEQRGCVISSESIFSHIWGEKYFENSNNSVMVHIRHLREKMGEQPGKPKWIKTVWGVGYTIEKDLSPAET